MTPHGQRVQRRCSFCGRLQDGRRLVAGPQPDLFICRDCVDLCRQILAEAARPGPDAPASLG